MTISEDELKTWENYWNIPVAEFLDPLEKRSMDRHRKDVMRLVAEVRRLREIKEMYDSLCSSEEANEMNLSDFKRRLALGKAVEEMPSNWALWHDYGGETWTISTNRYIGEDGRDRQEYEADTPLEALQAAKDKDESR